MKLKFLCLGIIFFVGIFPLVAQWTWYNPFNSKENPLQGRYWNQELGMTFHRLPDRAAKTLRNSLWELSKQSAGVYLKFRTNASRIQVKYKVASSGFMPHMPLTGTSGVDLYAMDPDGNNLWCAGKYVFGDTIRYTYDNIIYSNPHDRGNEYCLYLPLYNEVSFLEIGVPADSRFDFLRPNPEKPIVIYGTSIVQGACASRPGMAWTNILQRKLDMPIINMGFSGNAQLDAAFFELLAEIDAALFVIDCMPNMTEENQVGLIAERLEYGIRLLREKSNVPILLVEHGGYMGYKVSPVEKKKFTTPNEQLYLIYQKLNAEISDLYYLTFEELGLAMDCQVDGIHASDWGMMQYAQACALKIEDILFSGCPEMSFIPRRQHRDLQTYSWEERHREVLLYNQENHPEIAVLGNSIVHFWGGQPLDSPRIADDVWQKMFAEKKVVNLGYGWDRIENVMWRILHGELDGFQAKQVYIMVGTNNLLINTDEEIVRGILEVADLVRWKQPQAEVYVVKILPRRNFEKRIQRLNDLLEKECINKNQVNLVDFSYPLLDKDGFIREKYFRDGLHPNHIGYEKLAEVWIDFIEKE